MKRLLTLLLMMIPVCALAQPEETLTVSGKIIDSNGNPIEGASIYSQKSYTGAITDGSGLWTLLLSSDEILVVGCLGYKEKSILASEANGQTIMLEDAATTLEDVVVIGYGTKKRENLTGAISNISGDARLQSTTNTSFAQNLAGKVAGLQIRQEDGEPGSFTTSINVRGLGAPLYVIDGVPQTDGSGYFQRLNANDIESVSIIKDATGAVYGRRGGEWSSNRNN